MRHDLHTKVKQLTTTDIAKVMKDIAVRNEGKGFREQIHTSNKVYYDRDCEWFLQDMKPKLIVDEIYIDNLTNERFRCRKDQTFQLQTDDHNIEDKQPGNINRLLVASNVDDRKINRIFDQPTVHKVTVGESGFKEFNKTMKYIVGCDPY
tara:strand:+ start:1541 stop:1990 length:450 start_codon:yes stop_codon:yes gene_type:complete